MYVFAVEMRYTSNRFHSQKNTLEHVETEIQIRFGGHSRGNTGSCASGGHTERRTDNVQHGRSTTLNERNKQVECTFANDF